MSPTRAAKRLNPISVSYPAAVFTNNHGAEVDIWGVGKLILSCQFLLRVSVSDRLMDIGRQMIEGKIGTATEAQNRIRQSA